MTKRSKTNNYNSASFVCVTNIMQKINTLDEKIFSVIFFNNYFSSIDLTRHKPGELERF